MERLKFTDVKTKKEAQIMTSLLFTLFSKAPAGVNYAPNTGDTPWQMIMFIGLAVAAVGLLVFISTRKKK